jgi:GNAT superfamily N-acetyltransferase
VDGASKPYLTAPTLERACESKQQQGVAKEKEPHMDGSQNLCQTSSGQEDDWKILYEHAFPADERMPVEELRRLIGNGTVVLHKTTNKQGELLCFSLVNLMSNFGLLAYIATDTTKRSTGVGSKHMKHLIDILKKQHGSYIGLFLEIESTKEQGLDTETHKARTRRLGFYQRLGAKRLHKQYLMPSYAAGGHPRAGELLWFELGSTCVQDSQIKPVIEEIFTKGYNLAPTDPLIQQITAQFGTQTPQPSSTTGGETCVPVEHPPATASSNGAGSSTAAAGGDTNAATGSAATVVPVATPVVDQKDATDKAAATPVVDQKDVTDKAAATPVVDQKDATDKAAATPVVDQKDATDKAAATPVVDQKDATDKAAATPVVVEKDASDSAKPVKRSAKKHKAEDPKAGTSGDVTEKTVKDTPK